MKNRIYGSRILSKDVKISENTIETSLNNNDLIIGASGCGKTGSYVIPNVLNLDSSMVITDTKGALYDLLKDQLIEKGYKVERLDFVNPKQSCGYNPFDYVERLEDGGFKEQDIMSLANMLWTGGNNREPFWDMATVDYICFLMAFMMEAVPEEEGWNLCNLVEIHEIYLNDKNNIAFEEFLHDNPDSLAAKKFACLAAMGGADKMRASILGIANVALGPYMIRESKYIFDNKNNFDINRLGKEKMVLFVNVSDTDRAFDSIINIFYAQVLNVLCKQADNNKDKKLKIPVRLIIDDFAANAVIPEFDKIVSVIRSRDIYVSVILQSLSQLNSMYGRDRAVTILNNCDHIIYMGTQDLDTAQYVSSRAFKSPESILNMSNDKVCIISKGSKAQFVNKLTPYSSLDIEETEQGEVQDADASLDLTC